jgi:hypothetical protein
MTTGNRPIKRATLILAALAVLLGVGQVKADSVLYDNGPISGQNTAYTVNYGNQVSDLFTLTQTSVMTKAQVGLWVHPCDVATSLDWTISTQPTGNPVGTYVPPASVIASGTASGTSLTNTFQFSNSDDIYQSDFSLGVTLNPGTYWLSLGPNGTQQTSALCCGM